MLWVLASIAARACPPDVVTVVEVQVLREVPRGTDRAQIELALDLDQVPLRWSRQEAFLDLVVGSGGTWGSTSVELLQLAPRWARYRLLLLDAAGQPIFSSVLRMPRGRRFLVGTGTEIRAIRVF